MTARSLSNFINFFKTYDTFATADITAFFRKEEPDLKQSTINSRVFTLVNHHIITRISKGLFRMNFDNEYVPSLNKYLLQIAKTIRKRFPFIDFCVWDTAVINSFAQHITNQTFFVVEVEKEAIESVFHYLQEKNINVFFNPSQDIIDNYMFHTASKPYVLKNRITESPTKELEGTKTASLEKILVDIYCDKQLFSQYQGNELVTLYKNCFDVFNINKISLLRYASRRGKSIEIKNYINQIICSKL